jgi:hypothetical protein
VADDYFSDLGAQGGVRIAEVLNLFFSAHEFNAADDYSFKSSK